jgi:hypothetical protein
LQSIIYPELILQFYFKNLLFTPPF